jgi:hypothetical protein
MLLGVDLSLCCNDVPSSKTDTSTCSCVSHPCLFRFLIPLCASDADRISIRITPALHDNDNPIAETLNTLFFNLILSLSLGHWLSSLRKYNVIHISNCT